MMRRRCAGLAGRAGRQWRHGALGAARGLSDDAADDIDGCRTPWVRQVVSGVDLLRNPKYNKGLCFGGEERDRLHLRGLLPPAMLSGRVQLERTVLNVRGKADAMDKYTYLMSLHERNQTLFYRVLIENLEELLPVVHNPTMRLACQRYSLMFRSLPRGLFITLADRGRVYKILKNWPERRVKLMVCTDGENLGPQLNPEDNVDLGCQAIGVPVSKLMMMTAAGGVHPDACVPVVLDVGTDNEELLASPFYVGVKERRSRGEAYNELMDEFLTAVRRRYGNTVMIQFVDMKYENATSLVGMYQSEFPCLHDGSQGRAATILAGVLGALPLTGRALHEHRFLLAGRGELVSATAEVIAMAVAGQTGKTLLEARENVWLLDSRGLVTRERGNTGLIESFELPYCHSAPACPDLITAVKAIKPTVLIGCSFTSRYPFPFDEHVCRAMAENAERPIIFPLTPSGAECTAQEAYNWTAGRCITAQVEGTSSQCTLPDGTTMHPSQCNTTYIFPGVALGTLVSRSVRLSSDQFVAAASAVARLVTDEDRSRGAIFPPLDQLREVAAMVARAVAQKSYEAGTATHLPKPTNLLEYIRESMYVPGYRTYR
ncbi:unnamed protein product [Ostreobium quekettii]|uniref:Malic enzyme n=1 Tax=Ostreobium quekettii TaxID=121088 RepID=A0A8S1IPK5_9CHLO|nr:unnamed protein product [Ostreobium quekettii]|eukprot:evm.model.scf_929.6 EVM.evm.TU.scf_929.6   scf_929:33740-36780(+)